MAPKAAAKGKAAKAAPKGGEKGGAKGKEAGKEPGKEAGKEAGKEPGKGKEAGKVPEEEEYIDFSQYNPFKKISPKKIWIGAGIFSILCIAILIPTIHVYLKLKAIDKLPTEEPMKKLRRTMAIGLRNPNVNYENYVKVAREVVRLPEHVLTSQSNYNQLKIKYQSLFRKSAKSVGGWDLYETNLYYISNGKKTWHDAENFCMARDAHLASILTSEEQNYITSQFSDPFWIGLTDENMEGTWEWVDGSRVITEDWASSKQNLSKGIEAMEKDCVFIETSFGQLFYSWKDANCHELKRWACKEVLDKDVDIFDQITYLE